MTDEQKKALTLFLDRTWHTYKGNGEIECSCGYIPWYDNKLAGADALELTAHFKRNNNCTFTTWQDLGDVKEKLVEKGMWDRFEWFAYESFKPQWKVSDFIAWLFRPVNDQGEPHFCQLVADFLEMKG